MYLRSFMKENEKKSKYTYQAPTKESAVGWILRASEETEQKTIKNGKFMKHTLNNLIEFNCHSILIEKNIHS